MTPSHFTQLSNLVHSGPLVQLVVGVSGAAANALTAARKPVPPVQKIVAMVDTGATASCIQTGIAAKLGLNPIRTITMQTASHANVQAPVYSVRFGILASKVLIDPVSVCEMPLNTQNLGGLIGRDILSNAVFVYTGFNNMFSLSF